MSYSRHNPFFFKVIVFGILILFSLGGVSVFASTEKEQGSESRPIAAVGLRDTRYVYGSYFPIKGLGLTLEQSLYSVAIGYQRTGITVGYRHSFPFGLWLGGTVSGASTWKGSYQLYTAGLEAGYSFKPLFLSGTVMPSYDTGLFYYTAWKIGAVIDLTNHISLNLAYSTIPEYRMSEKRLQAGFGFWVKQLQVSPRLSFSMGDHRYFQDLRVLVSMEYEFMKTE